MSRKTRRLEDQNMQPTTVQIIKSSLQADQSLSPRDRAHLLILLRDGATRAKPESESTTVRVARIIRRREAAERLACSLRTVDKLAASGVLRKHKLPGRVRAAGFLERDLNALLSGEA